MYWFEVLHENRDGTVTARNITEGAKRKVESVQVHLEKDLLYPLLRGRDVSRWKAAPSAHLLFVQDAAKRRGIAESELSSKFPLTHAWLLQQKGTLLKRASQSVRNLMQKHAFYSMFGVGEYSLAPWKVAWAEVANEVNAGVVGLTDGKPTLADHTLVEIVVSSEQEAHYVAGVLNCTLFRMGVASYIVMHPDPHILNNFRIPKFDRTSAVHLKIAAEVKRLSGGASDAIDPVHPKLDSLCAQLWGVDEKSLKSVEIAYRELHVSEAEPAPEKQTPAGVLE